LRAFPGERTACVNWREGGIPAVDWQYSLYLDRHTIIPLVVSAFSDDGLWWWDGTAWVATAQVVLPDLPKTESEKSGRLELARADKEKGRRRFWLMSLVYGLVDLSTVNRQGFREYRTWTIEQLALATVYLLGPTEPMLAGEVSVHDVWDAWTRDLAVAVTAAHVLVFRIDFAEGQPRWIGLAGRATDVKVESRTGLFGWLWPAIEVTGRTGRWTIWGFKGAEFDPNPVLDAWRQAASGTVQTGR
jgi:hypothetical protein